MMYSVDKILVMTNAELARLMWENRHPNGNIELPVDGWDRLSKDERTRLADRLMCVTLSLSPSNDSYVVANIFI